MSVTNPQFKPWIRDACGQALAFLGATAPTKRLQNRLSIITFHRVLTEVQRRRYPLPGLAVTPEELDAHLTFAKRHFHCTTLSEALDVCQRGGKNPRPLLAVTFDDGQMDNHENALPVLRHHAIQASFFVTSRTLEDTTPLWHDSVSSLIEQLSSAIRRGFGAASSTVGERAAALLAELAEKPYAGLGERSVGIESALENTKRWQPAQRNDWIQRASALLPRITREPWDGFMTVGQLKELLQDGHEIGSHSHTHPLLPQCTDEELVGEIEGSKRRLESALGVAITTFCYPNGSTDHRSVDLICRAGYRAAVTTRWGSNLPNQNPYLLKRFDMNARHAQDRNGRFSEARLAWRMSGLHPGLTGGSQEAYASAIS